jgi:predicted GH43/DUF377 family glycosyl hydrolase
MKINMAALKKTNKRIEEIKKKKVQKTIVRHVFPDIKRKKVLVKKTVARKKLSDLDLKRSTKNPIIKPEANRYWESKATFNPSAIYYDGKIHVIYRAIGDSDISVLGYARSDDGYFFDDKLKELAYYSRNKKPINRDPTTKINYASGGGWGGGCEDPRLTLIDGKVYMIYTAFDGWGSLRMALTSISLDDFISRRFNWAQPVLISPPGQIHKNWTLFPEKIKGKYAILHAISPHIMIDYFDSLDELDGNKFIYSVHQGSLLWAERDKFIRGIGPAPIKTKEGWLVLYHKTEKHETHRYKLAAMILDLKDPTKILYNSTTPILEPDLWYENEGYKSGVIYSCGAVVKPASTQGGDEKLFVYYGGADKVSCVATADLSKFLEELKHSKVPKLKPASFHDENKKIRI